MTIIVHVVGLASSTRITAVCCDFVKFFALLNHLIFVVGIVTTILILIQTMLTTFGTFIANNNIAVKFLHEWHKWKVIAGQQLLYFLFVQIGWFRTSIVLEESHVNTEGIGIVTVGSCVVRCPIQGSTTQITLQFKIFICITHTITIIIRITAGEMTLILVTQIIIITIIIVKSIGDTFLAHHFTGIFLRPELQFRKGVQKEIKVYHVFTTFVTFIVTTRMSTRAEFECNDIVRSEAIFVHDIVMS
mmetsp:Transcript_30824/g.46759  ORF Transcript_30824/g.46759 Transcript_30824/m.46759 type:complete len:246 (-) Transcript_30824:278-1015(-)